MNPGETRHLHRAISTVVANLSPKQLELRAEDLLKYLEHRKHILELPDQLFEIAEPKADTLRAIAAGLAAAPQAQTMLDRRLGWLARSMRLSAVERAVLAVIPSRRNRCGGRRSLVPRRCRGSSFRHQGHYGRLRHHL